MSMVTEQAEPGGKERRSLGESPGSNRMITTEGRAEASDETTKPGRTAGSLPTVTLAAIPGTMSRACSGLISTETLGSGHSLARSVALLLEKTWDL